MMYMSNESPTQKKEELNDTDYRKKPMAEAGGKEYPVTVKDAMNISLVRPDGMKTHQEMDKDVYDPIANPICNTLKNKQGVGDAGYDYSNWNKAQKDQ